MDTLVEVIRRPCDVVVEQPTETLNLVVMAEVSAGSHTSDVFVYVH